MNPKQSKKQTIRALFTHIAPAYDKINRLLSLGQDQSWRRRALDYTQVPAGGKLLDVATGTGDVALLAAKCFPSAQIIGVDLTPAMLREAQRKAQMHSAAAQRIHWVQSDGLTLAFPDDTFNAVISVFMLRNVPDVSRALAEQVRVVRPGGHIVCMEMTWPRRFPMTWLFQVYFFGLAPLLGQWIAGDRAAYTYLPRSVKQFPTPATIAGIMEAVGIREVTWELQMLGTVAIFVGVK